MATGSTIKIAGRYDWSETCTAETFCDGARVRGFLWCERHVARASAIGAVVPAAT